MDFLTDINKDYVSYVIEETININSAYGVDNMTYKHFTSQKEAIVLGYINDFKNHQYKFKEYKELLILKNKHEKPRCISIPTLRDKVCLKLIQIYLYSIFSKQISKQEIPQAHIKKMKTSLNRYDSFIKIDIKNFFDSIDQKILCEKLKEKIEIDELNLVLQAIKNKTGNDIQKKGVPQGISISNILVDIYLAELDYEYEKNPDLFYTRYVDDIVILCNSKDINAIYESISFKITKELKLDIHEGKTMKEELKNGFSFLGYRTYVDKYDNKIKMTIKDEAVKKIERKIIKVIQEYKYSDKGNVATKKIIHSLNLIITGAITKKINAVNIEKRYGWLFFYSQTDSIRSLYHLDSLIHRKIGEIASEMAEIKQEEILNSIKKFTIAYREIKYNYAHSNYIFRPDQLEVEAKKSFLIETYGFKDEKLNFERNRDKYSKEEDFNDMIDKIYYKHVYLVIKKQEKDILHVIS